MPPAPSHGPLSSMYRSRDVPALPMLLSQAPPFSRWTSTSCSRSTCPSQVRGRANKLQQGAGTAAGLFGGGFAATDLLTGLRGIALLYRKLQGAPRISS